MAKIHDLFIIDLADVFKGYGNDPDVEAPFRLSEFYRFYELPNIAVSRENFEKMRPAQPEQRWLPCSERLPEEPYGCLVTVWDTNPVTMDEFENILPYFVGWDGEQWNDGDGEQCPFEVVAWMPLPEPFHAERSKQ